jgi:hypothetical protein
MVGAAAQTPQLPQDFTAFGVGMLLDGSNCSFSQQIFYSADRGEMRTDTNYNQGACTSSPPFSMLILHKMFKVVQSFQLNATAAAFICQTYPVSGWMDADYLQTATLVTDETTINTAWGDAVSVAVYNSTGQYPSGYLLTSVTKDSNAIVRHSVMLNNGQTNYQVDFTSFTPSSALGDSVFNPFPNVGCMPV